MTRDGCDAAEACKRLEDAGADVVGLNCIRGPRTMLPLLEAIRAAVELPRRGAARSLPHARRSEPTFQSLRDPACIPTARCRSRPRSTRSSATATRSPSSAATALELGVRYLGVCCGAGPHHIRASPKRVGRTPPASRYTADMSKHAYLGTDPSLCKENQEYAEKL